MWELRTILEISAVSVKGFITCARVYLLAVRNKEVNKTYGQLHSQQYQIIKRSIAAVQSILKHLENNSKKFATLIPDRIQIDQKVL